MGQFQRTPGHETYRQKVPEVASSGPAPDPLPSGQKASRSSADTQPRGPAGALWRQDAGPSQASFFEIPQRHPYSWRRQTNGATRTGGLRCASMLRAPHSALLHEERRGFTDVRHHWTPLFGKGPCHFRRTKGFSSPLFCECQNLRTNRIRFRLILSRRAHRFAASNCNAFLASARMSPPKIRPCTG